MTMAAFSVRLCFLFLSGLMPAAMLFVAVSAHADSANAPGGQEPAGCTALIDTLHAQFEKGDPRFLYAPVTEANCMPSQKHDAFFHQGLGLMFLQRPTEAMLHFRAALDHEGPYRESAWHQFWKAAQEAKDNASATEAVLGLYAEFPESRFLPEMLDATTPTQAEAISPTQPSRDAKPKKIWQISTQHHVTGHHEPGYRRDYTEHRLQGGLRLQAGEHLFQPAIQFGSTFDFENPNPAAWKHGPELSNLQGEISLGYMRRWLFATTSAGFAYDYLRREYENFAGTSLAASLAGWNYPQLGASLGVRLPLGQEGWDIMVFGSANRFHEHFQNLSVHSSLAYQGKPLNHQFSFSLERLFIQTPGGFEIDSTHLEPYDPANDTNLTSMNGLWGYEGEYRIEWRNPTWRIGLAATWREERRILQKAADSVWVVSDADATTRFALAGEAPATERRMVAAFDLGYIPHRRVTLKATARTGYLWVQSTSQPLQTSGALIRFALQASTHF